MSAKKKPAIIVSDAEGAKKKEVKVVRVEGKARKGTLRVGSEFEPRLKSPGDIILSDDWNDMQEDIKDDLVSISHAVEMLSGKSSTMIASGIASHGVFVELEWDVQPHVLLSPSGTVGEAEGYSNMICYAHDLSSRGFREFSQSRDGKVKGIVNWIAIGVT